jgi:hypothetical protein
MLSESYRATILTALAHEATPAAIETILELDRLGWDIPTWIKLELAMSGLTGNVVERIEQYSVRV